MQVNSAAGAGSSISNAQQSSQTMKTNKTSDINADIKEKNKEAIKNPDAKKGNKVDIYA